MNRQKLEDELGRLERVFATSSHLVAGGQRPLGARARELAWWRAAYAELQRRRWSQDAPPPAGRVPAPSVERRGHRSAASIA
jgi:hypothetical protein